MLAFIDGRVNSQIKKNLSKYFEVIDFETKGITYDAISGHPDIFILKIFNNIYIPKNLPLKYLEILKKTQYNVNVINWEIGGKYPESARLNIAFNGEVFIHNLKITPTILKNFENLRYVHIKQGYSRCSIIPLKNFFITSDKGVEKALMLKNYPVKYVDNTNILLEGFSIGFIGGTCGIWENKIFFMGSLKHYSWGDDLRNLICNNGYEIIELYDGYLIDGGTIVII
ncbi:MAG TPA: hypothetical protein PLI27_06060 [Ignavibacteriales bacterium]|nr:hypothetical protein [Ignavibacteriales bacterium]HOL80838.1 hypothetical protein [Ignavibacteriales bacterium]HOM65865.1 hypothetical protein [Ignavibacteriales bacterium]HPD67621.1 hypothetical protein [Ignavibacteriales bacterium]HPP33274.1 hypothetical protein [Ignavibacteriales bacterium]